MKLGCFSVSLAVKDLQASKKFYENLGFEKFHGDEDQGWLIMKNGKTNIGLFQGMFENNILTFNPGWDQDAQNLESFTDAREIQSSLKEKGIDSGDEIETESGPASFMVTDPDGNTILIDQHV
ncbi:MAG: VOC family protein [Acidobacteria bacterium]|nr:MAG: VOC family protein [Acidobacteriota bacterium]REK02985.1 MAG: VOC family protein [Acidobacteriota bacterium]REK13211.1 MAG: VOC family protein [Acidobacteriota bacterium]REK41205.1 MAG: VOC family protein [Acidobacteriota bacterium]